MFIGYLHIFLGEMSIQYLCPFIIELIIFLLLICKSSLIILDFLYAFPYLIYDLKILSVFFELSFTFMMVPFEGQKFLVSMTYNLSFFLL